jgi:hypothetical protein
MTEATRFNGGPGGGPTPGRRQESVVGTQTLTGPEQGPLAAGLVAPVAIDELSHAELRTIFSSHPLNVLVVISNLAVTQYRQRFRVSLEIEGARRDIYAAMRARGQFTPNPPEWLFQTMSGTRTRMGNIGFMVLDDEIALPLRVNTPHKKPKDHEERPFIAVTCLYRISPQDRRRERRGLGRRRA